MVLLSGQENRFLILAPLLVLLLLPASAAAQVSAEAAYRAARGAADADDLLKAEQIASRALNRKLPEDQWYWALKVLNAEIAVKTRNPAPIIALQLPAKYATSEAAVFQQLALGFAAGVENPEQADTRFVQAERLAANHQPHLLLYVHLARINVAKDYELHARKAIALAKNKLLLMAHALNALTRKRAMNQKYRDAVASGEKAVQLYKTLGVRNRLATASGNLGWAYYEIGNRELAEELFVEAERIAAQIPNKGVRSIWINQLGNVRFAEEKFEEALRLYQQARELNPADHAILTNIARTNVERGDYEAAARFLEPVVKSSSGDQLRRAQIVEARIDIARNQHATAEKKLRDVIEATEAQTKWTAQAHLALLYVRMRRPGDAERYFLDAINTARGVRESIKELELSISFYSTAREVFDGYVDFLVSANRKEDALAATELIRQQDDRNIDARAFAKRTGATIFCYWLGRDGSHVWRVTPTEVVHERMGPRTTIAREVEEYRKALADRRGARVAAPRGRNLYDMLIAPVRPKLAKNARVYIVADGALHALNFETLIPPAAPQRYWIEDVIVSNAASLQPRPARKATAGAKMLLVGDPLPSKEFPRLALASKEIDAVANHFQKPVVLRGAKATPRAFKAAAPQQFDFVHFAAHGEAVRKRPFESSVILSPDYPNDYRLFARDVAAMKLRASLVTISSCYGAGDRTFAGEGLIGLAWAFSNAGADQVIAALTKVDDSIAPQLMDAMYREIRKGDDAAVALRKAKLKFVTGGGAYSTPRYWAPFVLYSGN
jgi:CHAT domain-containing protein